MKRIALIVNPVSGRAGRHATKLDLIRYAKHLSRLHNLSLDLHLTRYPNHATELAQKEAFAGTDVLIAVGGDGTVNEVAQGLVGSETALGIVPMGSGNGLARHLDLPLIPRVALRTTLLQNPLAMEYGQIDGKSFFTTAGIGFDAEVGWMFAQLASRGMNSYIKATAQLFFDYTPHDYEIVVDGKCIQRKALLITFANASQFGNNARIAPHALVNDGLLQMVVVHPFPKIAIPYLASLLFHGRVDTSNYVETIPFRTLSVRCQAPLRGHVDGEPIELPNTFDVAIANQKLQILPGEHATELTGEPAPAILVPYQYIYHLPRPRAIARKIRQIVPPPLRKS